jgi:phosphoribosylglycinamide formyltransferase-1
VKALERATAAGIPTVVVDRADCGGSLSAAIDRVLPRNLSVIVLAGFLSILGEPLLTRFAGRIINLHPALLPKFGGSGMYGMRVHRAVLEAGECESGCTVHLVDEGTDTGPVLLQRRVPVYPGDTADALQARVAEQEHRAIVEAVDGLLYDRFVSLSSPPPGATSVPNRVG